MKFNLVRAYYGTNKKIKTFVCEKTFEANNEEGLLSQLQANHWHDYEEKWEAGYKLELHYHRSCSPQEYSSLCDVEGWIRILANRWYWADSLMCEDLRITNEGMSVPAAHLMKEFAGKDASINNVFHVKFPDAGRITF